MTEHITESRGGFTQDIHPVESQETNLHLQTVWDYQDEYLDHEHLHDLRNRFPMQVYGGADTKSFTIESPLITPNSVMIRGEERRQMTVPMGADGRKVYMSGLAVQRDFLLYPYGENIAHGVAVEVVAAKSDTYVDERITTLLETMTLQEITHLGLMKLLAIVRSRQGGAQQ